MKIFLKMIFKKIAIFYPRLFRKEFVKFATHIKFQEPTDENKNEKNTYITELICMGNKIYFNQLIKCLF